MGGASKQHQWLERKAGISRLGTRKVLVYIAPPYSGIEVRDFHRFFSIFLDFGQKPLKFTEKYYFIYGN